MATVHVIIELQGSIHQLLSVKLPKLTRSPEGLYRSLSDLALRMFVMPVVVSAVGAVRSSVVLPSRNST